MSVGVSGWECRRGCAGTGAFEATGGGVKGTPFAVRKDAGGEGGHQTEEHEGPDCDERGLEEDDGWQFSEAEEETEPDFAAPLAAPGGGGPRAGDAAAAGRWAMAAGGRALEALLCVNLCGV